MDRNAQHLRKVIFTALFAAIIYVGIWVLRIPIPALVGRPFIHFGNPLMILAIIFLGGGWGFVAGAIGLGGFDVLNGYAATSWLTVCEVAVMAMVITLVTRAMDLPNHSRRIGWVGVIGGTTKLITTFFVGIVESMMVGTSFTVAAVNSFLSLPATLINSIATAIIVPILYLALKNVFARLLHRA